MAIINTSSTVKMNVTFKGKELGFVPNERKVIRNLSERDQKLLCKRYGFLTFVPNEDLKNYDKTKEDRIIEKEQLKDKNVKKDDSVDKMKEITLNIDEKQEKENSPVDEYISERKSIVFAEKETIIKKDDDVVDEPEGIMPSIPLDGSNKKESSIVEDYGLLEDDEEKKEEKKTETKNTKKKTAKKSTAKKTTKKKTTKKKTAKKSTAKKTTNKKGE